MPLTRNSRAHWVRVFSSAIALGLALLATAGCQAGAGEPAATKKIPVLKPLWEHAAFIPQNTYDADPQAVSRHHWIISATMDNSPGTVDLNPSVALDYGIGDLRTGKVRAMKPLTYAASKVTAVPGQDLFVVASGGQVGLLDPEALKFRWTVTLGDIPINGVSEEFIKTGAPGPEPVCLSIAHGSKVSGGACKPGSFSPSIDGVRLYASTGSTGVSSNITSVPGGGENDLESLYPITEATDDTTGQKLWSYANASTRINGNTEQFSQSVFVQTDTDVYRLDESRSMSRTDENAALSGPDIVLNHISPRTGKVLDVIGSIPGASWVGAGEGVAVFVRPVGREGKTIVGYSIPK